MLSYRHGFHAGNHADVLKHLVVIALLNQLKQKDKPFCFIDTHAGKGIYPLSDDMAQKNAEYLQGVAKVWQCPTGDPLLSDYQTLLRRINPNGKLDYYPGSPAIAQQLCREQDVLSLMELHSQEAELLRQNFRRDRRVRLHQRDGFEGLLAILPPTPRRGLALIDPAYEVPGDYDNAVNTLAAAHRKWPVGVLALWYPLLAKKRDRSVWLKRTFSNSGFSGVLNIELAVKPQAADVGMHGSGMLIVNPPWQLDRQLQTSLSTVAPLLVEAQMIEHSNSGFSLEWLAGLT